MQQLKFEAAWDRTISQQDRMEIEEIFEETKFSTTNDIQFTPLWIAVNHKKELLVSTLIQNFSNRKLTFDAKEIQLIDDNHIIAKHKFSLPSLEIEPLTSMPWTFIFPFGSFEDVQSFETAYLEFGKEEKV